ncbi:hypothetical protein FQN60_004609, partial [Etheostoma spectabile]
MQRPNWRKLVMDIASWLCETLQPLSPACCVCLLEENMKQLLIIISQAQAQSSTCLSLVCLSLTWLSSCSSTLL